MGEDDIAHLDRLLAAWRAALADYERARTDPAVPNAEGVRAWHVANDAWHALQDALGRHAEALIAAAKKVAGRE